MMTLDDLRAAADDGSIDTVIAAIVDMQGRLMGKRFHVRHFLDHAWEETHCCNYLLATDLAMSTVEGYASTSWSSGYGDYLVRPDLSTLMRANWAEGAALVLCDIFDHEGAAPITHAPRNLLKSQIAQLSEHGLTPRMATELEYFLFRGTADEIRRNGLKLEPVSDYNEDYHLLQTSREEPIHRPLRNALYDAGIPVEGTKGEAEAGQSELNIRYGDGTQAADWHVVAKQCVKEIAGAKGHTASFLPKWHVDSVGSASHIHMSLVDADGRNVFHDPDAPLGMSDLMRTFVAGQLKYAPDFTLWLAPYVNSYKRFKAGSFAPTRLVWSVDNRTAAFRLVGANTKAVRIECRIGGSDLNPYLAMAGLLAAGLEGISEGLTLQDPATGDAYAAEATAETHIPSRLTAATEAFRTSKMLRRRFGDAVVDHYTRMGEWEQEAFEATVTDWEIARGFELA